MDKPLFRSLFLLKGWSVGLACSKGIMAGIGQRKIHLRRLRRTKVTVRARLLHLVEGIAEHLIMGFLAVEKKINGFSHLFILYLAIEILVNHLGSLLGRNIG